MSFSLLFVDDSPSDRQKYEKLLAQSGFQVDSAKNSKEALEFFGQKKYTVVILDHVLANDPFSGAQLVDQFHYETPDLKCVILSGFPALAVSEGYRAGAIEVLTKDEDDEILVPVLKVLIAFDSFSISRFPLSLPRRLAQDPHAVDLLSLLCEDVELFRYLAGWWVLVSSISEHPDEAWSFFRLLVHEKTGSIDDLLEVLNSSSQIAFLDLARNLIELGLHTYQNVSLSRFSETGETGLNIVGQIVSRILAMQPPMPEENAIKAWRLWQFLERTGHHRSRGGERSVGVHSWPIEVVIRCIMGEPSFAPLDPLICHWDKDQIRGQSARNWWSALVERLVEKDWEIERPSDRLLVKQLVHFWDIYDDLAGYIQYLDDSPYSPTEWLEVVRGSLSELHLVVGKLELNRQRLKGLGHIIDMVDHLVKTYDRAFVKCVIDPKQGYRKWIKSARRPQTVCDIVPQFVVPQLSDPANRVVFIVFDGMSLWSWQKIWQENLSESGLAIEQNTAVFSTLPSATFYSRWSLFSGVYPGEFQDRFGFTPEQIRGRTPESVLLSQQLIHAGLGHLLSDDFFVVCSANQKGEISIEDRNHVISLIREERPFATVIFDPYDKTIHQASHWIEDYATVFYQNAIHPLIQYIASRPRYKLIITADHGHAYINKRNRVQGIEFREGDDRFGVGPKFGKRYIALGGREFSPREGIPSWLYWQADSEEWGLPPGGYIFAVGNAGFSKESADTSEYGHGGISLSEMVVPVVVLRTLE